MATKLEYRSVFISDLHLGSRGCRAKELNAFLKRVQCRRLYLVGDVIDMWRLKQRWYWPKSHNKVIRRILRLANSSKTEVIFIPGNHDEAARQFVGLAFGDVTLKRNAVHETADGRRLLVTHGDEFDMIVQNAKLISMFGSWCYDWLVTLNRVYNKVRLFFGKPYRSFSQAIKLKVKRACTFISAFEQTLIAEAGRKGLDGVVCGHIHKAECRPHDAVAYFNCGDWVESCTALVEHDDGKIQLIDGIAIVEQLREQEQAMKAATRRTIPLNARPSQPHEADAAESAGSPDSPGAPDKPHKKTDPTTA